MLLPFVETGYYHLDTFNILNLEMVKMVHLMLYGFYHNKILVCGLFPGFSIRKRQQQTMGQFFLWLCIKAANKDLCFTFCCMFLLIWWVYMSKAGKQEVGLGACLHCQDMDLTTKDGCSPPLPLHTASGVVEIWTCTCVCMLCVCGM